MTGSFAVPSGVTSDASIAAVVVPDHHDLTITT
jgi:hypothetical protein